MTWSPSWRAEGNPRHAEYKWYFNTKHRPPKELVDRIREGPGIKLTYTERYPKRTRVRGQVKLIKDAQDGRREGRGHRQMSRYTSKLTKVKEGDEDKWNLKVFSGNISMWDGYKLRDRETATAFALVYAANFLRWRQGRPVQDARISDQPIPEV